MLGLRLKGVPGLKPTLWGGTVGVPGLKPRLRLRYATVNMTAGGLAIPVQRDRRACLQLHCSFVTLNNTPLRF